MAEYSRPGAATGEPLRDHDPRTAVTAPRPRPFTNGTATTAKLSFGGDPLTPVARVPALPDVSGPVVVRRARLRRRIHVAGDAVFQVAYNLQGTEVRGPLIKTTERYYARFRSDAALDIVQAAVYGNGSPQPPFSGTKIGTEATNPPMLKVG